ncbi:hypothetical protein CYMTET_36144 [Cymbomonas tetramitiformis]|uniref:Uncharacterized protein n=1 Tax=Cymbomonas tetramitiformis TaxID=36881 RepID=A0AAE0F7M1_9CHLO|nr:hypothetical protein CYMTET_36144 [Cymbomonas tetramitiformis]
MPLGCRAYITFHANNIHNSSERDGEGCNLNCTLPFFTALLLASPPGHKKTGEEGVNFLSEASTEFARA